MAVALFTSDWELWVLLHNGPVLEAHVASYLHWDGLHEVDAVLDTVCGWRGISAAGVPSLPVEKKKGLSQVLARAFAWGIRRTPMICRSCAAGKVGPT